MSPSVLRTHDRYFRSANQPARRKRAGSGDGRAADGTRVSLDVKDYRPRAIAGYGTQTWRFFARGLLQQVRDIDALFLDAFLHTVGATLVGVIFKGVAVGEIYQLASFIALCLGLISAIYALRTFGNEKVVFYRESAAGAGMALSRVAYFFGKVLADIPKIFMLPGYFLLVVYGFLGLSMHTSPLYAVLLCLAFNATGFGYFLSVMMHPAQAQLATVVLCLVLHNFGGGVGLTLPDIDAMGFGWLADLTFTKWTCQAIFVGETRHWSPVWGDTIRALATGTGLPDPTDPEVAGGVLGQACLAQVGLGVLWRALALLGMISIDRHIQNRTPVMEYVRRGFAACWRGEACRGGKDEYGEEGLEEGERIVALPKTGLFRGMLRRKKTRGGQGLSGGGLGAPAADALL